MQAVPGCCTRSIEPRHHGLAARTAAPPVTRTDRPTPVRSTVDGVPARFRGPCSLAGDELVQTQDRAADLTPGRPLAAASPGCETLELCRVKLPGQFGFLR